MTPVRVSASTDDEQVLQSCQNLNFTYLLLDKVMGAAEAREWLVC